MECDVCILGAGTAGVAAAYALAKFDLNVVLVEQYRVLGGTAVNGWVQTWINGIAPPYLENILSNHGYSSEEILNSILPARFNKNASEIILESDFLSTQYEDDLNLFEKIRILREFTFKNISCFSQEEHKVKSITVEDKLGCPTIISASFFIDSSSTGILCRSVGGQYYIGEDPHSRFNEDLMPIDDKADEQTLNEPSLFYSVVPNSSSDSHYLDQVKTVYEENNVIIKPDYIGSDGYANQLFCNPMTGLGLRGYDCLGHETEMHQKAIDIFLEHWKYVKLNLKKYLAEGKHNYRGYRVEQYDWNYTEQYAPMLGVRESYRIKCDYMLRQSDLIKLIDTNNLEDFIACGSHTVDFHTTNHINREEVAQFNRQVCPSGIPFRSLVPVGMDNVLIACKAYGASHIALAARRVNKDMAQLGWAAGHAMGLCIKNQLSSVRDIKDNYIKELQEITGFKDNVDKLLNIYNNQ